MSPMQSVLDEVKDVASNAGKSLSERLSNDMFFSFFVSWSVIHYQFFIVLWKESSYEKIMAALSRDVFPDFFVVVPVPVVEWSVNWNVWYGYIVPFLFSFAYVLAAPFVKSIPVWFRDFGLAACARVEERFQKMHRHGYLTEEVNRLNGLLTEKSGKLMEISEAHAKEIGDLERSRVDLERQNVSFVSRRDLLENVIICFHGAANGFGLIGKINDAMHGKFGSDYVDSYAIILFLIFIEGEGGVDELHVLKFVKCSFRIPQSGTVELIYDKDASRVVGTLERKEFLRKVGGRYHLSPQVFDIFTSCLKQLIFNFN